MKRLSFLTLTLITATLLIGNTAWAHVVVTPAETVTAGWQTFTVSVPNEKDSATTDIKLLIPSGLTNVTPTQKTGWQIDVGKQGNTTKSVSWHGSIDVGMRDEFTFSAKVPAKTGELHWKAYQAYTDGSVVSWDKSGSEKSGDSGPFSVTKIVAKTEATTESQKAQQAAAAAKTDADRSFYVAVAGVIIGLAGVFFATKRK